MFPIELIDSGIKTFLNKKFLHTPVAMTVEKKELFIVLSYLGNLSLALRTRLQNSINKNLPFCKIKVIFKSTTRLSNFFRFKDKVPFNLRSNVVYKFSCGRCNATYYGKTYLHFNIRAGELSSVSPLTREKLEQVKQLLLLKIICSFAITQFPSRTSKFWQVVIQNFTLRSKKVLILRDKPKVNRNEKYLLLIWLLYSCSNILLER